MRKQLRFRRDVAGMEKVVFENICIHVTDMNITSFTDELKTIIQNEEVETFMGLTCG